MLQDVTIIINWKKKNEKRGLKNIKPLFVYLNKMVYVLYNFII